MTPIGGGIDRARAQQLDDTDPLASWRDQFDLTAPGAGGRDLVYLDGNSLGRTPLRTIERLDAVVRGEWARDLIRSWDHWLDLPQRVGDCLAPLIGAAAGEVAVHDSTSVNLYQLVHGALALRPDRAVVAIDAHDFPSDRYIVDGIAAATGRTVRHGFDRLDDVAVVVRSLVDYRTAEVVDIASETARATAAGALVIWDLSHAAGVLAVDLHAAGAQLAVGCTYKFLNGGPGAPAFTYVARALQAEITQPIWGWFSQRDQFAMGPDYRPRPDIGRMLIGTPSILALAASLSGAAATCRWCTPTHAACAADSSTSAVSSPTSASPTSCAWACRRSPPGSSTCSTASSTSPGSSPADRSGRFRSRYSDCSGWSRGPANMRRNSSSHTAATENSSSPQVTNAARSTPITVLPTTVARRRASSPSPQAAVR
jgi:kynureninase